jgi:hypothetical protein
LRGLGGLGSNGAILFHCASLSNGPDRAIGPPSALLTLLISYSQKLNHRHFNGLSTVVQQLLVIFPAEIPRALAVKTLKQALLPSRIQ